MERWRAESWSQANSAGRGKQSLLPGTEGYDGTTDYSGYLPPTKALNMQYKPMYKQTDTHSHKHADAKGRLES